MMALEECDSAVDFSAHVANVYPGFSHPDVGALSLRTGLEMS